MEVCYGSRFSFFLASNLDYPSVRKVGNFIIEIHPHKTSGNTPSSYLQYVNIECLMTVATFLNFANVACFYKQVPHIL